MKKVSILLFILLASVGVLLAEDYSLSVPSGWMKKSSASLAHYQKETGTFILTADALPPKANTPDLYISFVKEQLKGAFKEIVFEAVVIGKKDKYETRELKYTVVTYGMKLKYDVLYVFVKDKAYTLTTSNLESSINKQFNSDIGLFFSSFSIK